MIQAKALPKTLSFTELKCYIFSLIFIGLTVFVPLSLHQFHLAGPKFLMMHLFIMIAGLLFGWRVGLMVGVFSPLISFSFTQLPAIVILPEIILELGVYGLIIGLLREKGLNIWFSLLAAMLFGRLARLALVLTLRLETDPLSYFQISWPGMILQIILVPLVVLLLGKFLKNSNERAI